MTQPSLDQAQRDAVDRLCTEALALTPDQREARLEEEAGRDPAVADEARHILEAVDDARPFALDHPPAIEIQVETPNAAHLDGERIKDVIPSGSIGPYRLRRRIGEGGFGLVFEAEQTTPVQRSVAVKLLKPELDVAGVLARFRAESQTLARLQHPGIALVLDAGVTGSDSGRAGIPYVVMELVPGTDILEACATRELDRRRCIELMVDVCAAVRHAHLRGIIHRDLKPSNILLTERDGRLRPVVIDFGIARAVHDDDRPDATRPGQALGTPGYMAPEQRPGDRRGTDTRTDVYALGSVVRAVTDAAGPNRGARAVPSADLAAIVEHCLEEDPDRRYATAAELADDLRRLLAGRPVTAHRPGLGYRVRRFVRRHPLGSAATAAAAAIILTLTTATAIALVQRSAANRSRDDALDLAQKRLVTLETERARLDRMNGYLLETLALPGHWRPNEEGVVAADVRVRDALVMLGDSLDALLDEDPAFTARMRLTLVGTWLQLQELDEAHAQLAHVDTLADEHELPDEIRAEVELLRGSLQSAVGELDAALASYERGEEIATQCGSAWSRVRNGNGRTSVLHALGRSDEALDWAREIACFADAELGADHLETGVATGNLGAIQAQLGDLDGGIESTRRSLAAYKAARSLNHMAALIAHSNLTAYLQHAGRHEEFVVELDRLLESRVKILGRSHDHTAGTSIVWQKLRLKEGAFDAVLEENAQLVAALTDIRGDARALFEAQAHFVGATAELEVGRVADAADRLEGAIPPASDALGDDHPEALLLRGQYVVALIACDRDDEAAAALAALRSMPAVINHRVVAGFADLGEGLLLARRDQRDAAHERAGAAHAALEQTIGPEHPSSARARRLLESLEAPSGE